MFGETTVKYGSSAGRELAQGEVWVLTHPKFAWVDKKIAFEYGELLTKGRIYTILKNGEHIRIEQISKLGDPNNEIVQYKVINNNGKADVKEIFRGIHHIPPMGEPVPEKRPEISTPINPWIIVSSILGLGLIGLVVYLIASKRREDNV